jgi:hypothetical protein
MLKQERQVLLKIGYRDGPCPRCGGPALVHRAGRYRCDACARQKRERQEADRPQDKKRKNREAQQRRRHWEKLQRHLAAGLVESHGGKLHDVEQIYCKHCGEWFCPIRCTARYCSPRCRMAAHRARGRTD